MVIAHSYLSEINSYKPGRAKIGDEEVIKLSSNENALGASQKAIEAYEKHSKDIFRYGDGPCFELREALAEKYQINADNIVCGAGSDEILALLASAFAGVGEEVIYSDHGFLMYPISAKRIGAKGIAVPENNLKADVDAIISATNDKTKIIFIANPNNPTGSYLNNNEIDKLIANISKDVLIVLDLAYSEFVDKEDYPDAIKLVNENDNVVMTRTFSKIYGLPSLRIGWSYSSSYIADVLNKVRGPFNVGGPAQFAAIAALRDEEFIRISKEHNDKWLRILAEEFAKNPKINPYPSIGNFILLDFGSEEECKRVNQLLLDNKIILREMSAYKLPNCLRMTIGREEENLKVLEILGNI